MTEKDAPDEISAETETEVVDELMDHVASLLESQMRTANRQLRNRAARLLTPSRPAPGTGVRIEGQSSPSADAEWRTNVRNGASNAGAESS